MIKTSFYIIVSLLLLSCSRESLSEDSVVESNIVKRNLTELDIWIRDNITLPYGIRVEYRWDGNTAPKGNYNYPPNEENVKKILLTIKELWIDLYNDENVGKANFMKGKNPLKIYLYGGKNVDSRGVELLGNNSVTNAEMHLYNVNDFDPNNPEKVFILMRSVHHQFAKRLAEIIPYDRDAFVQISQNKYLSSTDDIADVMNNLPTRLDIFKVRDYANKRGFYTLHSFLGAEDDFAEIISATLTHSPRDISTAATNASTPYYDDDAEVQQQYNEEAKQSYKEFIAKQKMVDEYFSKKLNINLRRLQLTSIQKLNSYQQ